MFLGFMVAGIGHGWSAPLYFSLLLFIAYPAAFARWADALLSEGSTVNPDIAIVALAVVADLVLVLVTLTTDRAGFLAAVGTIQPWTSLWLLFWLGWQVLAVVTLRRRRRSAADSETEG